MHRQRGMALLVVLVLLVAVGASSVAFVWFMQQQTRASSRHRSAAALAAAEAGVHRALAVLEGTAPAGGPGRTWRPVAHTETVAAGLIPGRFTLAMTDAADGSIIVTSVGEVVGSTRRLRARVVFASPALLAGLFAQSLIRLENPGAAMFILPYGAAPAPRGWVHMAAGQGIWFATTGVAINDGTPPSDLAPGPGEPLGAERRPITTSGSGRIRVLLSESAAVMVGADYRRVDMSQVRSKGVAADGLVHRVSSFPSAPTVDRAFYKSLASNNLANAAINRAAGEAAGNDALARKRDSLYSQAEFQRSQAYLQSGRVPPRLHGVVYVTGGVSLLEGQRLQIADGALIAEHTVELSARARMEITHTTATRTLPGLLVADGALFVTGDAYLRAHGLVYAARLIDVHPGARLDIVGALMSTDSNVSFRSDAALVVIRYDPVVLGTRGLRAPDPHFDVAWVTAWEELP